MTLAPGMIVCGYARVSVEKEDSHSVDDQLREIKKFCELHKLKLEKEYTDDGISGKTIRRRPGIRRMLADAKNGKFKMVIAFSLDRVGRSLSALTQVALDLDRAHVKIHSVKEGPADEIQLAIRLLCNAVMMKGQKEHLMKGMTGLAAKGRNLGRPPIGLRIVVGSPGEVEEDPKFGEIPRIANDLFLDENLNLNPQQVARELNNLGYRTREGNPFNRMHLAGSKLARGILNNPAYIGKTTWNVTGRVEQDDHVSTYIKDKSEHVEGVRSVKLIEPDRFQAAQDKLARLKTGRHSHAPGRRRLLSGLLRCPECEGSMMVLAADTRGRKRIRCDTNYRTSKLDPRHCWNGRTHYIEDIEDLVLDAVSEKLSSREFVQTFIDAYNGARGPLIKAYDAEDASLRAELGRARSIFENLVGAVSRGLLKDDEAKPQLDAARATLAEAEERLRRLSASPVALSLKPGSVERFRTLVATLSTMPRPLLSDPAQRPLLDGFRSLIDRVVVIGHPEGHGFRLEIHGLLAALTVDPGSALALVLENKSYKRTELKGPLQTQILTIYDFTFIIKTDRHGAV